MKHYLIFGKNRHIPVCFKVRAKNMGEAKTAFYIGAGDTIINAYRVPAKHTEIRSDAYPLQH